MAHSVEISDLGFKHVIASGDSKNLDYMSSEEGQREIRSILDDLFCGNDDQRSEAAKYLLNDNNAVVYCTDAAPTQRETGG